MKTFKLLLICVCVMLGLNSCSLFNIERGILEVQEGMTKNDVTKILGKPDLRRFDYGCEEWEFVGGTGKVCIVRFQDNVVSGMDTFFLPPKPATIHTEGHSH